MKKQARGGDTVRKILDAAAVCFADGGFDGARVDFIAEKAGVNKATLYYRVGDKKELYRRVLLESFEKILDEISKDADSDRPPVQRLRLFIRGLGRNIGKNRRFASIMMREVASAGKEMPAEVFGKMLRIIGLLRSILDDGRREGVFREVNTYLTHIQIIGGIMFYVAGEPIRQRAIKKGVTGEDLMPEVSAEDAAELMADLIIKSLKPEKKRAAGRRRKK